MIGFFNGNRKPTGLCAPKGTKLNNAISYMGHNMNRIIFELFGPSISIPAYFQYINCYAKKND